ncbi:hypothetical protein [Bradyrhizobium sp.]|jgi:hypothetical protein|uniref:hypothetical protein n=1 Tax=Bradyrhizobium sp. TaxID=376 RepID=UPI002DFFD63F|nr:hypothetical protein [Bradyrhizobium sp.]
MGRKKGDLPGRYVPPHIRKCPKYPGEYVNVAAYQEHVDPTPAKTDAPPPQIEFDFEKDSLHDSGD